MPTAFEAFVRAFAVLPRAVGKAIVSPASPLALEGFDNDFRESGLRWLFYAAFAGVVVSVTFLVVDSLTLAESVFITVVRLVITLVLLLFAFSVVRFRIWVLKNYNTIVASVVCLVLMGVAAIVGTPGVVAVDDGFSSGPLLLFCLFLLYGFVRLPLSILLGIGIVFTGCMLALEGASSSGPAFHRLFLYAVASNLFGALLAFFIMTRERLLFRERLGLRLSREGLRQRAVALQASRDDMRRLMRAVDHDLKQPLLAADVSVSALASAVESGDRAVAIARLEDLKRVAAFLRASAEDVLSLASVDEWGSSDIGAVDLGEVVRDVLTVCAPLASRGGVEIFCRFAAGEMNGYTNRPAISRALVNLVVNAVKFSSAMGVSRRRVLVAVRRGGASLRLCVYDCGPGIEDFEKQRIWEPFYRSGVVGAVDGSGLGLYLVKRIVDALSGHSVSLRSNVGRGSGFCLSVPSFRPDLFGVERSDFSQREAPAAGAYVVVLLVADAKSDSVRGVLSGLGADVDVAAGVRSLLGLAEEVERMVDALIVVGDSEPSVEVFLEIRRFSDRVGNVFPVGVVVSDSLREMVCDSVGLDVCYVNEESVQEGLLRVVTLGMRRNLAVEVLASKDVELRSASA